MWKAFLAALVKNAEQMGEVELDVILQEEAIKNPEAYQTAIHGGKALTNLILPKLTAHPVASALVTAIDDAINISAKQNGVTFEQ